LCLGKLCYINVDTGNSSYTDESSLADDGVCSITLTNPVRYFNDLLFNARSVMPRHDDHCDECDGDDDDVDGTNRAI